MWSLKIERESESESESERVRVRERASEQERKGERGREIRVAVLPCHASLQTTLPEIG